MEHEDERQINEPTPTPIQVEYAQDLHGVGTNGLIGGNSFIGDNGSEPNVGNEGDDEIGDDVAFKDLC